MRRRHPHTGDRLRAFLASVSFPVLLAGFLMVIVVISALLAIGFALTATGGESSSFLYWWKERTLALLTLPTGLSFDPEADTARFGVQLLAGAVGLLLPALFFGATVFKLFISPQLFVLRNKLALMPTPPGHDVLPAGGHYLALRLYSRTRLRLVDLTFSVVSENERTSGPARTVVRSRVLEVANPGWPVAATHHPRTVQIPLRDGDVDEGSGEPVLRAVQGFEVGPNDCLQLLIRGTIPDLGSSLSETHRLPIQKSVSSQPFEAIDMDLSTSTSSWPGWEKFDE